MGGRRSEIEHTLFKSEIKTIGTTLETNAIAPQLEKHYVGVRYYSDASGTPATPGAGTVAIEGLDEATGQWTTFDGSPLASTDVTAKATAQANITKVRAVPTGITVATHWQLFVSSNL